jgi:hypothetical protein
MSRQAWIGIAGLGVVVVIALTGAASGRPTKRTVVLHAHSQVSNAHLVDNAPTGRSAGDQLVFTERLRDSRGRTIGSDAATCTVLFDARSLCTGVYSLRGGQVMVQLVQPGPTGTYRQAITGGTGRYARAGGTVTVDQRSSGDRFTFRIRVLG